MNVQVAETMPNSSIPDMNVFNLPETNPFEKAREKGIVAWMFAHIFHGINILFVVIWFIFTLTATIFRSWIMVEIGNVITTFNPTSESTESLVFIFLKVLLIGLGVPTFDLSSAYFREMIAQRLEREVRHEFYVSLLKKSQSFHDKQRIGDLMARATGDVRMLNWMISPALSMILASALGIIIPLVTIVLRYPVQLLIVPVSFDIIFIISLYFYIKKLSPVSTGIREEFGNLNAELNESLSGIELVKTAARAPLMRQQYKRVALKYRNFFVRRGEIEATYFPLFVVGVAITAGVLHAALIFLNPHPEIGITMDIGQIVGYVGVLSNLQLPTMLSIWSFSIVSRAVSGSQRLIEIMNIKTEIQEPDDSIAGELEGNVKFANVWFKYPGTQKYVLKNINFEVNAGQTLAIVGTTGSGKTTLTKLISRLYDIDKGEILIDGDPIESLSLDSLRQQISYIEQDIFLFSDSIMNNITFGRTGSLHLVEQAAKDAQAHEFITQLPKGYESEVGERGVQLSGGERQRIAIARAFLSNPKILVLDDSTSAIDSRTEELIQQAIFRILKGRTTLLITHRLSQIRWADKILVMRNGTIVAQGTHYELLKNCEEYRKIFTKRFDKSVEELLGGLN